MGTGLLVEKGVKAPATQQPDSDAVGRQIINYADGVFRVDHFWLQIQFAAASKLTQYAGRMKECVWPIGCLLAVLAQPGLQGFQMLLMMVQGAHRA